MATFTIGGGDFATIAEALASGRVFPGDTLALLSGYNTETATVGIENLTFRGDASNTGIALTLSTGIMGITLTGSAPIAVTGNESDNSITGNDGSNVLAGGEGNDSINGDSGDDTMIGGGGDDTMISGMLTWQWFSPTQEWPTLVIEGAGNDTMIGGAGDDTYVVSGTGDQVTENSGEGFDTVVALVDYTIGANIESLQLAEGAGKLTGTGNDLDNVLVGNSEPNTLYGMEGDDFLVGGGGFYSGQFYDGYDYGDALIGGVGNDTYFVGSTSDVVTENPDEGFDTVQTWMNYTLGPNIEKLVLLEGAGSINGTGNDLDNVLVGNSNDNRLSGMGGDDTMIGGAGNDIYLVDSTNDVVTENPDEGNDIVFASVDYTIGPNIESLGRWVSGDATVIGGAGDDFYLIDSTSALVTENPGEGNDTVYALVDCTIGPNIENLMLLEGALSINGTGNDLNNVLVGNSEPNTLYGMEGDDLLDGKGGDDTMTGGAGDDLLDGKGGDDTMTGGAGDDTMTGGAGNDSYYVDSTSDVVTENPDEGTDRVYASADYTIGPNIEQLWLLEGPGSINGTGNDLDNVLGGNHSGDNVLDGKGGDDRLYGAGGDDTMIGGAGNDIYSVDSISDVVTENRGEGFDTVEASINYTLGPNIESLQLYGAASIGTGNDLDNELYGNPGVFGIAGNDTLIGLDGNDRLWGGGGGDTMIGGAGNDFYFVDTTGDVVMENPGEGNDFVVASIDYTIGPNIESLALLGDYRNLNGTGNALDNVLNGTSGNNVLDGKGGHDRLTGNGGNDTFVFATGEADGDWVDNVTGIYAVAHESFRFVGFGTAADGATFTQIGDTNQWRIHSGLDGHNEVITFLDGTRVQTSDYVFLDATGNTPPAATADSYSTNEDQPLNIAAAAGVLLNDTDADSDPLTAVLVSGVQHGTLALNANGSFSYAPNANYNGPDSFTYKAYDGGADSNVATVSLTVNPLNDAPVASSDSYATKEDTTLSASVLANDSDVDGDALTVSLVSGPAHGTVVLTANGSFTYTPAANYNGADSFTYKAYDGQADSNVATVSLTVTPVNAFVQPSSELAAFAPGAGGWSSDDLYPRTLADVNGDNMADIVGFASSGVMVSLATGNGHFAAPTFELPAFAPGAGGWSSDDLYPRTLADVNGDQMADIVGFASSGVMVSLATGNGHFAAPTFELPAFAPGAGGWSSDDLYPRTLADVNGDNMADIVGFASSGVMVSLATGNGHFAAPTFELAAFAPGAGGWSSDDLYPRTLADVNGDQMADIVGFASSGVMVSLATGNGHFAAPTFELPAFAPGAGGWSSDDLYPRTLADVNGDNMADIVGFASSGVMVSLATGNGHFAAPTFELPAFAPGAGGWSSDDLYPRTLADVTGDNMTDIVGFASSGVYVSRADFLLV